MPNHHGAPGLRQLQKAAAHRAAAHHQAGQDRVHSAPRSTGAPGLHPPSLRVITAGRSPGAPGFRVVVGRRDRLVVQEQQPLTSGGSPGAGPNAPGPGWDDGHGSLATGRSGSRSSACAARSRRASACRFRARAAPGGWPGNQALSFTVFQRSGLGQQTLDVPTQGREETGLRRGIRAITHWSYGVFVREFHDFRPVTGHFTAVTCH